MPEESGFNATFVSDSPKFRRRRGLHSPGAKFARPKLPAEFDASAIYKSDSDPKLVLKKGMQERVHHRPETRKSRPKLPDAFQAGEVYRKEIDSASQKPPVVERIKKMVHDEELLDDDERHRQLINRLSNRIKKSAARMEEISIKTEASETIAVADDDAVGNADVKVDALPDAKQPKEAVKPVEPEEHRFAMELDEPPIPTMRRRIPPRSDLDSMFASESRNAETKMTAQPKVVSSMTKPHTDSTHKTTVYTASDISPIKAIPKSVDSITSVETTNDITEENHPDPSTFTKVVAACVVVCMMSIIVYFTFM